jgi:hypothetical protein
MKNGTFTYGTTPNAVITAALKGENFPMQLPRGEDADAIVAAVNQGIDSHLEAITDSRFYWAGGRLVCDVAPADMLVLLRRLGESDSDAAMSLRSSILTSLEIEEI